MIFDDDNGHEVAHEIGMINHYFQVLGPHKQRTMPAVRLAEVHNHHLRVINMNHHDHHQHHHHHDH